MAIRRDGKPAKCDGKPAKCGGKRKVSGLFVRMSTRKEKETKSKRESKGKARKSKEKQGKARKSKEKQGKARKSKEKQGKAGLKTCDEVGTRKRNKTSNRENRNRIQKTIETS